MFDAKKLLEQIIGGGAQAQGQQGGGLGGLGDLLGQLTGGGQGGGQGGGGQGGGGLGDLLGKLGGGQSGGQGSGGSGDAGGLGDLLREFTGGQGAPGAQGGAREGGQLASDGGGLGDLLGKLQRQAAGSGSGDGGGAGRSGESDTGGIMDILGQILGQATDGVKEGAGRISDATGAGDALDKITGGRSGDDLMAQLQELIANNKLGAGAAAGGLGALVLGTKTGRGLAVDAAKLGGLVLIGGLAYKAYQNFQQGKPLINTAETGTEAAPEGSGFEPQAVTNDSATLYIRAMIAAAAADGRVDQDEQQKIFGSMEQAGFDDDARAFLQQELANPASIDDLADSIVSDEEAAQVFTAARMAVDFDTIEEQQFLMALAGALDLEPDLIQHIDAAARGSQAA